MRPALLAFIYAALLAGLAACARPLPEQESEPEQLVFAWIPRALDNPLYELGRQGAEKKAAEINSRSRVQVQVLTAGSINSDAAEQVRVIEDVISRGVDGIAISCIDPTACLDPIHRAVEAGIPVITWDADSPGSKRFTYLGLNNFLAGKAAGNLLVSALRGEGKVAVLTGVPGAYNQEERIRGFQDTLNNFPQMEIVATVAANEDINLSVQVLEETMQAHPELDGWFFTGMWPLFADRKSMPLWESASRSGQIKTVAFDTLPVELQLIEQGYIFGLVGQQYNTWGYDAVQILYDHIVHGRNYPPFINSGMQVAVLENVASRLLDWQNNDLAFPLMRP